MTKTNTRGRGEGQAGRFFNKPCGRNSPYLMTALVAYACILSVVIWSLIMVRNWALAELTTPRSIEQWREWREDVREQQTEPGPVRRRVPKSSEPPALVLMRDYFSVSLFGAILFTSVLYWVVVWFVMGILQQRAVTDDEA